MNASDRVILEPDTGGGRPCSRGLGISVYVVLAMLAEGRAETEIPEDFPELQPADIRARLAYAAIREQSVVKLPAQ